jgi:hypothetical protein
MRIWNRKVRRHIDEPDEVYRRRLKTYLRYDLETGYWWRLRDTAHHFKDTRADRRGHDGYYFVSFQGKTFRSHVLAHFYVTGLWPEKLIDHKDGLHWNTRWKNLRPANYAQNYANSKLRKDNKSGLKGVHWNKEKGCWTSQIMVEGTAATLMHSTCPAAAHFAYLIAADKQYGEFVRAR